MRRLLHSIIHAVFNAKKIGPGLLFLFFTSCVGCELIPSKEIPSDAYEKGDKLYCIAIDGVNIRRTPSTRKQFVGRLKLGETVTFLQVMEDERKSSIVVNGDKTPEYWLKVSKDDQIVYIHGSGLRKKLEQRLNSNQSELVFRSSGPRNPLQCYITLADVHVRSESNRKSREVREKIKKGSVVYSDGKRSGQYISGCPEVTDSDSWMMAEGGWMSGKYLMKIQRSQIRQLAGALENSDLVNGAYIAHTRVSTGLDRRTGATVAGHINPGQIVFPAEIEEGEMMTRCDDRNNLWLNINGEWAAAIYFIKVERSQLGKLIGFLQ